MKLINKLVDHILVILILAMTIVVALQVFFRYVLNAPLSWPEEMARLMIVWLCFIGGYMALRDKKQIGFDLFLKKMTPGFKALTDIIGKVLTIVFLVVVTIEGVKFSIQFVSVAMPYTGLSYGLFAYTVFPLSGILMIIQSVIDTISVIKEFRLAGSPDRAGQE